MREPVLSVSACVEQDEQDNTTIAPFQIFDLSGAKYQLVIPYLIRNLSMLIPYCHSEALATAPLIHVIQSRQAMNLMFEVNKLLSE